MTIDLSANAVAALASAPAPIQRAFIKQIAFLCSNLNHPSLHAKKYEERRGVWQARVNDDWRFYFTISDNRYKIESLIPHSK